MPNVVDLRPGSFVIHTFSSNAHTVTLTFANTYSMGVIGNWTIWVASSPTSTHLVDITPDSLVGQVLTFTISAATTQSLATQSQSLYIAKSAAVQLAPLIEFDETSSPAPTSTNVTVASSGNVTVTVTVSGSPGVSLAVAFLPPVTGTLTTATGVLRYPITHACTIGSPRAMVNTAPTGSAIVLDVNKNGTTIFTTQANRPTIAIAGHASTTTAPDVTALAAGDYLTFDIDQIGSTIAGSNLTVVVPLS